MKPAIVMQTDFTKGMATCTMDGVIQSIDPTLRTSDCFHDIEPFNTYQASISLNYVVPFWPAGTIFVSVVDPGVGTDRRACVAKLKNGSYVVTPDNGTLTHLKKFVGIEAVRVIDETKNRLETTREVQIFHGRDLFAYCAAKLAAGIIDYAGVGPAYPVEEIVEHEMVEPRVEGDTVRGMIESSARNFGLVDSNIPYAMFEQIQVRHGDRVECVVCCRDREVYRAEMAYVPSFGYVPEGEPLVMISESKHLQIAKNLRNISVEYDIGSGPDWTICFRKR